MKKLVTVLLIGSMFVIGGCGNKAEVEVEPAVSEVVTEAVESVVEEVTEVVTEVETEEAAVEVAMEKVSETEAVVAEEGTIVESAEAIVIEAGDVIPLSTDNLMLKTNLMVGGMDIGFNANYYYMKIGENEMWTDRATLETYAVIGGEGYQCLATDDSFTITEENAQLKIVAVNGVAVDNGNGTSTVECTIEDTNNGEAGVTGNLTYSNVDGSLVGFEGNMGGFGFVYDANGNIPEIPEIPFSTLTYDEVNAKMLGM